MQNIPVPTAFVSVFNEGTEATGELSSTKRRLPATACNEVVMRLKPAPARMVGAWRRSAARQGNGPCARSGDKQQQERTLRNGQGGIRRLRAEIAPRNSANPPQWRGGRGV